MIQRTVPAQNHMEPLSDKRPRCSFTVHDPRQDKITRCPVHTFFQCPKCKRIACHEHYETQQDGRTLCLACAPHPVQPQHKTTKKAVATPLKKPQQRVTKKPQQGVSKKPKVVHVAAIAHVTTPRKPNIIQRVHYRKQGWLASGHGDCPKCGKRDCSLFRRWHFLIPIYLCSSCFKKHTR